MIRPFHVVTPQRTVVVAGADRARHLEDVTTQHVTGLDVGDVTAALHLDAHGLPLAAFDVVVEDDAILLVAPDADVAAFVVDVLGSRTFLADAVYTFGDEVVVAVRGDDLTPVTVASVAGDGVRAIVARPGGADLVVAAGSVEAVRDALDAAGIGQGTPVELEDDRITRGVPAWGREVVAPHLPEEMGLLPSHVHLAKGCYPGQEAVARMWMLGRPRRRLAVVALEGPVPVGWSAGEGRDTITVTSVRSDGRAALAFVPADAAAGDVRADGAVSVASLVGDGGLPPGADPAVTRRRDRAARPSEQPTRQNSSTHS
jgi:folate-binding protein YgfZ